MSSSYWSNTLATRINRRRLLAASAGTAAAAALLAACGGSDGDEGAGSDLVTKKADTSKDAKPGGTLKLNQSADIPHLDPINGAFAALSNMVPFAYGRLTMMKPGHLEPADGSVVGDVADSWEWSPDNLQVTFKLRQNVKFHPLPPVNGRTMDAEDVLYSWNRFADRGVLRADLANVANPNAPISSVTTPDARTVVMKLAFPFVDVPIMLATGNSGQPNIIPREAESAVDLRQTMLGTGPWMLSDYTPSVRFVFKRNPNYHLGDGKKPYIDTVERPVISEYAQNLAQLKSGGLHFYPDLRAEDWLPTKRDVPALVMTKSWTESSIGHRTIFGYKPTPAEETPFRDERLRQAYSMSIDRDLFIDAVYGVSKLKDEGKPMESAWNSTELQNNFFPGWWLDPKSKDFGPNAKYFELNIAEAKKLIAAAGFPNGFETLSSHITTANLGVDHPKHIEIIEAMTNEAGFRYRKNIVDYAVDYQPVYRDGKGNFGGLSYKLGPSGGGNSAVGRLIFFTHSTGAGFTGFDPDGRGTFKGDPFVDDTLDKAKGEADENKRKALVQEVQRYLAKRMYSMRWPGGATEYKLAWPAVKNFEVYHTVSGADRYLHEWIDQTLPPFRA